MALLVLLVVGPLQVLNNLLLSRMMPGLDAQLELFFGGGPQPTPVPAGFAAWSLVSTLISWVVYLVVAAATVRLAVRADRGEERDALEALRFGLRRLHITILGSLAIGAVGLVAFVVVLVVLILLYSVAWPLGVLVTLPLIPAGVIAGGALTAAMHLVIVVAVTEEHGPGGTIGRAVSLVRGRFWRMVGMILLAMLAVFMVAFVLQLAFLPLSFVAGSYHWIPDALASTVGQLISIPVLAFVALLLYLDARVRLEGYDLEVRARGL